MAMAGSHYQTPEVLQTNKIYPIFYSKSERPADGTLHMGNPITKTIYHKFIIDHESMSWLMQNAVQTLGGWDKSSNTETELIDSIQKDWSYIGAFTLRRLKHYNRQFFYAYTSLHKKDRARFMGEFLNGVPVQRTYNFHGEGYVRHVFHYIPITHLNPSWNEHYVNSSVAFVINRFAILRGKSANYFNPQSMGATNAQLLACLMVGCSFTQMNVIFFPETRSNIIYIKKYLEFLAFDAAACVEILRELESQPTAELYTKLVKGCPPVARYVEIYGDTSLFQRRLSAAQVFNKISTGGRMNWSQAMALAGSEGVVTLSSGAVGGGMIDAITRVVYENDSLGLKKRLAGLLGAKKS
jgi:hypothetical protein